MRLRAHNVDHSALKSGSSYADTEGALVWKFSYFLQSKIGTPFRGGPFQCLINGGFFDIAEWVQMSSKLGAIQGQVLPCDKSGKERPDPKAQDFTVHYVVSDAKEFESKRSGQGGFFTQFAIFFDGLLVFSRISSMEVR